MDDVDFVTSRMDTFRIMVEKYSIGSISTGNLYYYGRFGTRYFRVALQDATTEQLKSSGGLRYFKKSDVADAIARYNQSCREMQTLLSLQDLTYNDVVKARDQLFNAYYIDEVMDASIAREKIDSFKRRDLPLLSSQKNDFIHYANLCQLRSFNNKGLKNAEKDVFKKAELLLAVLKKEYNIK